MAQSEAERYKDWEKQQIIDQQEEIDFLKAECKRAFWWSAEFTHNCHDGHIQTAWEDYTRYAEMKAKEKAALGESK